MDAFPSAFEPVEFDAVVDCPEPLGVGVFQRLQAVVEGAEAGVGVWETGEEVESSLAELLRLDLGQQGYAREQ